QGARIERRRACREREENEDPQRGGHSERGDGGVPGELLAERRRGTHGSETPLARVPFPQRAGEFGTIRRARYTSVVTKRLGPDGSAQFVAMARAATGCEVLHQDFLALDLPAERFHGVFANASLFHVPSQELARVLAELHDALRPRGVLFSSNPRGRGDEGWH